MRLKSTGYIKTNYDYWNLNQNFGSGNRHESVSRVSFLERVCAMQSCGSHGGEDDDVAVDRVVSYVYTNVSEKYSVSIFRAKALIETLGST
jgi:hypothetical protein